MSLGARSGEDTHFASQMYSPLSYSSASEVERGEEAAHNVNTV